MAAIGRPEYKEEKYQTWLDEMKPYLELGNTLSYAIERAGLWKHKSTIYCKNALDDWFSEKIQAFQRAPGETVNGAIVNLVNEIAEKIKQGVGITKDDKYFLLAVAKTHRSAQPFFVSRVETTRTTTPDIGRLIDDIGRTDCIEVVNDLVEGAKFDKLTKT